MARYDHDTIVPFKDSGLSKKQQVADMFNSIAFRYDFLNRFLSGGIDIRWRKKAIGKLSALDPRHILDVATGTADMAIMMAKYLNPEKITGIDISAGMLEVGRKKIARQKLENKIELLAGDSESIPFPDNSFDAATVAFGVRNFEQLEKGLQEIRRVLKPGGMLVVLEFSKPVAGPFRSFCNWYLRLVTPGIGKLISRNREAYQYLNESVKAFPQGKDFIDILNRAGYIDASAQPLTLGVCSIYCGSKS